MSEERSQRFNDTTGAIDWNYQSAALHPDRCRCQGNDSTPHKHYPDPPYACARCGRCRAYDPANALLLAEKLLASEKGQEAYRDSALFHALVQTIRMHERYNPKHDTLAMLCELLADACVKREEWIARAVMEAMLRPSPAMPPAIFDR